MPKKKEPVKNKQFLLHTNFNSIEDKLKKLKLNEIRFEVLSFDDMTNLSVMELNKEAGDNCGLGDLRLGPSDSNSVCETCLKGVTECPGHFGRIVLNAKIINPIFYDILIKVLNSVCNHCSKPYINQTYLNTKGFNKLKYTVRLAKIEELSKDIKCNNGGDKSKNIVPCSDTQYIFSSNNLFSIKASKKEKKSDKVKSEKKIFELNNRNKDINLDIDIWKIIDSISDDDADFLGFVNSHPRDLILRSVLVLPPRSRPDTIQNGVVIDNPLKNIYKSLISDNDALKKIKDITEYKSKITNLSNNIEMLIHNKKKISRGNTAPGKCLMELIQGKEGTLRKQAEGKRVDFNARSVIGVDPTLKFGQIKIPKIFAEYLTIPEKVNNLNIDKIINLLKNGKVSYYIPNSGPFKNMKKVANKDSIIKIGYIAHRHLEDGDYVLAGRMPTLHKHSLMGYEVILSDQLNINIHMSSTHPHNADFDGDEFFISVPQTMESILELELLTSFKNNIMSAASSAPIAAVVYDGLVGLYLLTRKEDSITKINEEDIIKLINEIEENTNLKFIGNKKDFFIDFLNNVYIINYCKDVEYNEFYNEENYNNALKSLKKLMSNEETVVFCNLLREKTNLKEYENVMLLSQFVENYDLFEKYKNIKQYEYYNDKSAFNIIKLYFSNNSEFKKEDYVNFLKYSSYFEWGLCNINLIDMDYFFKTFLMFDTMEINIYEHFKRCIDNGIHPLSGKSLFSLCLPKDFNYNYKNLNIVNGILVKGIINSSNVGIRKQNSIIHVMYQNYGDKITGDFITKITKLGEMYAQEYGFTIGISDCYISNEKKEEIKQLKDKYIALIMEKELGVVYDELLKKKKEQEIIELLGKCHSECSKLVIKEFEDSSNNFLNMIEAGAKGSKMGLTQIAGIVGQNYFKGGRFLNEFGNDRNTPWEPIGGSLNPLDKGLIEDSYTNGLSLKSIFYTATVGRESLKTMALSTADTGYLNRKLVKNMEDLIVRDDISVRNCRDQIIQFRYGHDGYAAEKTSKVNVYGNEVQSPFNIKQLALNANSIYLSGKEF